RFVTCLHGWVVPIGIVLLIVFTFERRLTDTAAYAEAFEQWAVGIENVLLLVSIVTSYVAQAALFLVLYGVLPSRIGYIKALTFGAYLCAMFLIGVGADQRLIVTLPQLVIGRAVYYLSVPVLIGIYLDLRQHPLRLPGAETTGQGPRTTDSKAYFE